MGAQMSNAATWTSARTVEDADGLARATVDRVISARGWSGADIALSGAPLNAARDNSSDAATYWAALRYAWTEAGRIGAEKGLTLPPGWDGLATVWSGAAETTGYALAAEDQSSLTGILVGSIQGAATQVAAAGESGVDVLTWVNKHPVATVGLVLAVILVWQAAPAIAARLVVR